MALSDPRMSAGAIILQAEFADLGDTETVYLASPEAGYIKELHCIRDAAGGAGTSILTITTPAGAVAPALTLLTGGAAGDVDSLELSKTDTNNALAAGDGFSVASGGQFVGTPTGRIVVVIEPY